MSSGRRSGLGSVSASQGVVEGGSIGETTQAIRELRTRLNSLKTDNSMKNSFDISDFLENKEFDIAGKTYKDIFPVQSGPDAEELTNKFLYAVTEILLDFISQTNDRDINVLDFHHPSQITKAMDFSLPNA